MYYFLIPSKHCIALHSTALRCTALHLQQRRARWEGAVAVAVGHDGLGLCVYARDDGDMEEVRRKK